MVALIENNFVELGGVLQSIMRKLAEELGPVLKEQTIVEIALFISRKALRSIGKAVHQLLGRLIGQQFDKLVVIIGGRDLRLLPPGSINRPDIFHATEVFAAPVSPGLLWLE
jgi:hypothetical protein